jgi:uncharacterized OB-fold protein
MNAPDTPVAPVAPYWSETPNYLRPQPTPDDREFWEGAGRGELRIQRCTTCGLHQHYPRYACSHCGAGTVDFVTASGLGTVYSYTVIRQNGAPPFKDRVPFVVATIDLDEAGARLLAALPALPPEAAQIGMRVRAAFRPAGEEYGFVDFEPA